jgi:hypothetical protein
MHLGSHGGIKRVFAGDWIVDLLGAGMVVGSGMVLVGGSAVLFALVRVASGAGGLAMADKVPTYGVTAHAEEVRGRIRTHYMHRAHPFAHPTASADARFQAEADDPVAILVAAAATMPITKLPPLNESLRRGLAARAARTVRPTPAPEPTSRRPRRRRTARKGRPTRNRSKAAAYGCGIIKTPIGRNRSML